jgi:hypothetical protein
MAQTPTGRLADRAPASLDPASGAPRGQDVGRLGDLIWINADEPL